MAQPIESSPSQLETLDDESKLRQPPPSQLETLDDESKLRQPPPSQLETPDQMYTKRDDTALQTVEVNYISSNTDELRSPGDTRQIVKFKITALSLEHDRSLHISGNINFK